MKTPKVLVIRAPGTNCDIETANGFDLVGAKSDIVHISEIVAKKKKIDNYDILALPGGFSYGDYISAAKIFVLQIENFFGDIKKFVKSKRPVIGICNGFQVLVKSGVLPFSDNKQVASFVTNDCTHFLSQWEGMKINKNSRCIFTKGLPETFDLPIAHGEGKIVTSRETLKKIESQNCIAITYTNNPNGSLGDIAGLCNPEGNCLGIMPHPERFLFDLLHPSRKTQTGPVGREILKNAVEYVK
jgi:phosphoribosylformylglycinamidine synthase subunit PurQ / glutaminase